MGYVGPVAMAGVWEIPISFRADRKCWSMFKWISSESVAGWLLLLLLGEEIWESSIKFI